MVNGEMNDNIEGKKGVAVGNQFINISGVVLFIKYTNIYLK